MTTIGGYDTNRHVPWRLTKSPDSPSLVARMRDGFECMRRSTDIICDAGYRHPPDSVNPVTWGEIRSEWAKQEEFRPLASG